MIEISLFHDPSDRNETRPVITQDQLDKNAETYKEQVFKILDPDKTEIRFNSWMNQVDPSEFIKMLSSYTVARMLERDDFQKDINLSSRFLFMNFVSNLQGFDSVELEADVELGGTDRNLIYL